MSEAKITLTREELYERVWTTPMLKLAAEFGLSDRGLAKLCGRHLVPVPPRGYWARLKAGQSMKRTPLPQAAETSLGTIEIHAHEKRPQEPLDEMKGLAIPEITVIEDGPLTHRTALRIERFLSTQREDDRGQVLPRLGVTVPIQVSSGQIQRALRICDALLQAMEQAQYLVSWPKPYNTPLTVTVLEEPLRFVISEVFERREHRATAGEVSRQKLDPWWKNPKWDYKPTGRLRLTVKCDDYLSVRRSWSDGKKKRVEDALGHFVVSLSLVAKALKRQREEHAERQREWAEERKQEAERAAQRAEYKRRADVVEGLARSWDQSKSLRAFAEKLSSQADQADTPEQQRNEIRGMADWALRHAAFVDPFTDVARMIRQFKNPPWSYGS